MRASLARIAVVGGAGLLLVVVILLALLPGPGEERAGSAHSTEPDGWRALYLLCERLGFPVGVWDEAPGALRGAGTVLVLSETPTRPPGPASAAGAPRRARDPEHYARFLEEGGRILYLIGGPRALEELARQVGRTELEAVRADGRPTQRLVLALPGEDALELEAPCVALAGLEELVGATLMGEGSEAERITLAGRVALGAGTLVLVGLGREAFENGALQEASDSALFFVRLLEQLGPCERVLFDQHALGAFVPPSRLELLFSPALLPTSLHLLAWCALFLLAAAWVGPFARDPEALIAVAPLARARGHGGLLARAGRHDLLAGLLRRGLLERWNARSGTRTRGVEADLARLARGDAAWLRHARELFLGPPPRDAEELAGLARSLAKLERALQSSTPPSTAGTRPRPPSPTEP